MTPDQAVLAKAGVVLPPLSAPIGTFRPAMECAGQLFVSGQAPLDQDGTPMTGKIETLSLEEGGLRALATGRALLASVAMEEGRLTRLTGRARLLALINASGDFTHCYEVMGPCLDMLSKLLGQPPALSVVVVPALPNDITVEIEAVFDLHPM